MKMRSNMRRISLSAAGASSSGSDNGDAGRTGQTEDRELTGPELGQRPAVRTDPQDDQPGRDFDPLGNDGIEIEFRQSNTP